MKYYLFVILNVFAFLNTAMAASVMDVIWTTKQHANDSQKMVVSMYKERHNQGCQSPVDDDFIDDFELTLESNSDSPDFEEDDISICLKLEIYDINWPGSLDKTVYSGPYIPSNSEDTPDDLTCLIDIGQGGDSQTVFASRSCFGSDYQPHSLKTELVGSINENRFTIYKRGTSHDCSIGSGLGEIVVSEIRLENDQIFYFDLPEEEEFCIRNFKDDYYGPFHAARYPNTPGCDVVILDTGGNVTKTNCDAEDYVSLENIGNKNYDVIIEDTSNSMVCADAADLPILTRTHVQDGVTRHTKVTSNDEGEISHFCAIVEHGQKRQWHGPYIVHNTCVLTIKAHNDVLATKACYADPNPN